MKGLPRFTLTRGHVAVHDGEVRTQEGHGKFVAREPRPAVNTALTQWKDLTAPRPVVRTGFRRRGSVQARASGKDGVRSNLVEILGRGAKARVVAWRSCTRWAAGAGLQRK